MRFFLTVILLLGLIFHPNSDKKRRKSRSRRKARFADLDGWDVLDSAMDVEEHFRRRKR